MEKVGRVVVQELFRRQAFGVDRWNLFDQLFVKVGKFTVAFLHLPVNVVELNIDGVLLQGMGMRDGLQLFGRTVNFGLV